MIGILNLLTILNFIFGEISKSQIISVKVRKVLPTKNIFIYTDRQVALKLLKECLDLLMDLTSYFAINL